MELSCRFGKIFLPHCKQVVNFYYNSGLEVVERAVDLVFEEMVMKVVDLVSKVELVEWVEENIVVEKQGIVVDIEDIEDAFHKDFSILVPKVEAKIAKAWVQSNCFMMVVQMFEC